MNNSEVLLTRIVDALGSEQLLSVRECQGIEKLIISGRIKPEDWRTAIENHLSRKDGEDDAN